MPSYRWEKSCSHAIAVLDESRAGKTCLYCSPIQSGGRIGLVIDVFFLRMLSPVVSLIGNSTRDTLQRHAQYSGYYPILSRTQTVITVFVFSSFSWCVVAYPLAGRLEDIIGGRKGPSR